MSATREAVESIITTVPGFRSRWEAFLNQWGDEDTPWYLAMGDLASYVVESYEDGHVAELRALFNAVETALVSADESLKELVSIGFIEDLQNVASHHAAGAGVFRHWRGVTSLVVWDKIEADMRKVAEWTARQKPRWWHFWRRRQAVDYESALSAVENPELRRMIEQMSRKPH